jgi:hypothetical protein
MGVLMRALTDKQMEAIKAAAALVPATSRDHFLRSFANRLSALPYHITDADIAATITMILSTRGIATSTGVFCCDSRPRITRYRSPNK